jgi:hypothetical protein
MAKTEDTESKMEDRGSHGASLRRIVIFAILYSLSSILLCRTASAAPTQEQVLKSIHENVGGTVDPRKFFAFMLVIGGLIVLLALMSQRKKREVSPKAFNSQGKLLKEIVKQVDLRPSEIRQLKALAEAQGVSSPLTLLLCPSILTKAVKERSVKVDRKVILGVAKKLG